MTRSDDIHKLPADLPVPVDDGACEHLPGLALPALALQSTDGETVDLSALAGRVVIYAYPRTGRPDEDPPGGWDEIPGARGCTPQACAFRDHYRELQARGAAVYGLSSQTTDYHRELVERLHLPYPILSDARLAFTQALRLPTFSVESMTLIKRLTLIAKDGRIETVFYPVFPPDEHPKEVLAWLAAQNMSRALET